MTRAEALQVLGLQEGASRDEVAAAYRELAQMLHPDKYGENKRLRARAEQQMRRINEAHDVLCKGAGARRSGSAAGARSSWARGGGGRGARGAGASAGSSRASSPAQIRFEAEARAHAAETARLAVVAQLRTMRERRRSVGAMAGVAAAVMLLCSRMRGTVGALVVSVASMLVVWGIVDVVSLSGQITTLQKRSAELLRQRDAAAKIAEEAARL